MTESNGHAFGISNEYSRLLDRPSPERLRRVEPLRVNKGKALLAFLSFIVRRPSAEQHGHVAIESGWGHHVLPYHARCPE